MCSQAGDRGVADKQYMVDNNGNIVDVVSYCKNFESAFSIESI